MHNIKIKEVNKITRVHFKYIYIYILYPHAKVRVTTTFPLYIQGRTSPKDETCHHKLTYKNGPTYLEYLQVLWKHSCKLVNGINFSLFIIFQASMDVLPEDHNDF